MSAEYRERLKQIEFERERLALKEEQFKRLILKQQSENRGDEKRLMEKYQVQLQTREGGFTKRLEELEDKLDEVQRENSEL